MVVIKITAVATAAFVVVVNVIIILVMVIIIRMKVSVKELAMKKLIIQMKFGAKVMVWGWITLTISFIIV